MLENNAAGVATVVEHHPGAGPDAQTTFAIVDGLVHGGDGVGRRQLTMAGPWIGDIDGDVPATAERIDATGLIVTPGFIDLQINGGFGFDLAEAPESMWELARLLPRHGVTGFLPTFITSPPPTTAAAIEAIGRRPEDHLGAEPLGLHLEGPMLNPARKGAHRARYLRPPSLDLIAGWTPERGVALVTIAPELAGAPAVISALTARGIAVAAGHSDATEAEATAGLDAGVTMVTHLFNAMAPFGHRNPNLVGVTLARAGLAAGLIVDGVHVHPTAVAAAWNAKGPDGIVLVTDAVGAMGRAPGRHRLGGDELHADKNAVRNREGTLAGSLLTMDRAVRNLIEFTGCTLGQALQAATTNPAGVIGQTSRGRLRTGARADIVLLDEKLEVQITLCGGRPAFVADGARPRLPASLAGR